MSIYRQLYLIVAITVCASPALRAADQPFDFEVLQFRAKNLAAQPYKQKAGRVPAWLQKYTYDQLREIRFDPARTWWQREQLPFQLQFFHPGGPYNATTVQVNELHDKKPERIEFSSKFFNYGSNKPGRIPSDMGFAGFRIHYALNNEKYLDELVAFIWGHYLRPH